MSPLQFLLLLVGRHSLMDNLQLIDCQRNELVYSKQPIQMMLANGLATSQTIRVTILLNVQVIPKRGFAP